jgi:hypothetical protein
MLLLLLLLLLLMRKYYPSVSAAHWKSESQAVAAVQYECKVRMNVGGG